MSWFVTGVNAAIQRSIRQMMAACAEPAVQTRTVCNFSQKNVANSSAVQCR